MTQLLSILRCATAENQCTHDPEMLSDCAQLRGNKGWDYKAFEIWNFVNFFSVEFCFTEYISIKWNLANVEF